MRFIPLPLAGAYRIELDKKVDERGYFARTFCFHEFSQAGLCTEFVQMSTSFNHLKGQVRGMHYQEEPYSETKLIRCTRGAIYDVIVDLREESPTYKQFYGESLTEDNGNMLYVPKGFAHGYVVMRDSSEVFYMMDQYYYPDAAREISPDSLGIIWP